MEIGQQIVIGKLGQQPMRIADPSVDPQHANLKKIDSDTYQIEDNDSTKGIFVFGIRVKRKTVKGDTPIFLGTYKTTVNQMLVDPVSIDLQAIWDDYDYERRKWDRFSAMVNSIRMLSPVITMLLTQVVGQNWMVSIGVMVVVVAIAMIAGEKVLAKRTLAMAELNGKMQTKYVCPHCHKFLGLTPYSIIKSNGYCPNCGHPMK